MDIQNNPSFSGIVAKAQTAITFLYVGAAFDAGDGLYMAGRLSTTPAGAYANDDLVAGWLGGLHFVVIIVTAIFFAKWMYQAYANLQGLTERRLAMTPGWAVGYFFVPIANFYLPLRAMKEIWLFSDPSRSPQSVPRVAHQEHVPLLSRWWGLWIASGVVSQLALRLTLSAQRPAELWSADWLGVLGNVLSIPAALFCVQIVRTVTGFQTKKAAATAAPTPAPTA